MGIRLLKPHRHLRKKSGVFLLTRSLLLYQLGIDYLRSRVLGDPPSELPDSWVCQSPVSLDLPKVLAGGGN